MEIRYLVSRLIRKYRITVASDTDPEQVWKNMTDQFLAVPGRLELVFDLLVDRDL